MWDDAGTVKEEVTHAVPQMQLNTDFAQSAHISRPRQVHTLPAQSQGKARLQGAHTWILSHDIVLGEVPSFPWHPFLPEDR